MSQNSRFNKILKLIAIPIFISLVAGFVILVIEYGFFVPNEEVVLERDNSVYVSTPIVRENFEVTTSSAPDIYPTPTLALTLTPLPISTKRPDETLILVFTIYRGENLVDTAIQDEIKRGIENKISELKLDNIRVEVEPMVVGSEDRQEAERLAEQYDATQVIWGHETGARVSVNFWNRQLPDDKASDVTISETERTQLSDPASYVEFVVEDLPGQLAFLSLFALAQAYYADESNPNLLEATRLLEGALEALPKDAALNVEDQQVAAYFRLGWLNQTMGNLQQAKQSYLKAVELSPDYSAAYNNLGLVYSQEDNYAQALAMYDLAIEHNSDIARAYNNRAIARRMMGDTDGAISDYNKSIELRPKPRTYLNRGLVYQFIQDYKAALDDFNKAIEIDREYALAYYRRGTALYRFNGDCTSTIADYNKYLELRQDSYDRKKVEAEIMDMYDGIANGQCK